MNIFELKNSKLGMTLVEMVVALTILGILMSATTGMIISSNTIFISTSNAALDKQVGNSAFDYLESVLKYTTHLKIYGSYDPENPPDASDKYQSLYVNNGENAGKIMYKRAGEDYSYPLYSDTFYKNRSIQYSVKKVDGSRNHVKLTLTVFRQGIARFSREAVVKCVNLDLVKQGIDANAIIDASGSSAYNQFLSFSVDEMLIQGGKNAYSLEYNLRQYISKYNKIQRNYTNDLNDVYMLINNDYDSATPPTGLLGTEDETEQSILKSNYVSQMNLVNAIIFGNPSDYNLSTGDYVNEETVTFNRDGDDYNTWVNLRKYYQNQIHDLLKFTPTAAFPSGKGTYTTDTVGAVPTSFNYHTGNEFYGVVATKEELYAGFMLTYYDANGNGKIEPSEYPQFDKDSGFFENTVMNEYSNGSNNNDFMVILAYLKDNVADDNYEALIVDTDAELPPPEEGEPAGTVHQTVYVKEGSAGYTFNKDAPKVYVANDADRFNNCEAYLEDHTITEGPFTGMSSSALSKVGGLLYTFDFFGDKYTYTGGGTASVDLGNYDHSSVSLANSNGEEVYAAAKTRLGIKEIGPGKDIEANVVVDSSTNYDMYKGHYSNLGNWYGTDDDIHKTDWANCTQITITPTTANLPEGWYSYREAVSDSAQGQMYIFYLESGSTAEHGKFPYAVRHGNSVKLYSKGYEIKCYSYDQAQFTWDASGSGSITTKTTLCKTFDAHQYNDYVIYSVDWNSWFTNDVQGGLLERLITKIRKNSENQIKIDDLNGEDSPTLSLGNTGSYDTDAHISDRDSARSYNYAWCVYNNKRASWYYLPKKTTTISGKISDSANLSRDDDPIFLDCDIDGEGNWDSQAEMIRDIDQRKLSGSTLLFGREKREDAMWIALPTGASPFDAAPEEITEETP